MSGKKKVKNQRGWVLAGETIYPPILSPSEEQSFKKVSAQMKDAAICLREDGLLMPGAMSSMKKNEAVARAAMGFFFQYFDDKYQRADIVEAMAKAFLLPGGSMEYLVSAPQYMLCAVFWFLDYIENRGLEKRLQALIPAAEPDKTLEWEFFDVDDITHSKNEIWGVLTVIQKRNQDQRQAFKNLLALVDSETVAKLKNVFKDTLLDYVDRYLEVFSHIKPSSPALASKDDIIFPTASICARNPFSLNMVDEIPTRAKMQPDIWFLTQTHPLWGSSLDEIRKRMHFRRSSDLLHEFQIADPYAISAAYLFLEKDGDVLANMNILTVNIMGCAVRTMPWCIKEVYSYGIPFEEAVSDHTPRYPYSPCKNADEEGLPESSITVGDLLSEEQLFYLATGYILPRNQRPSSRLKKWFEEQGVPAERAEGLAWGAWITGCFYDAQMQEPQPIDESDELMTENPEEGEEKELTEDLSDREAELARQLKESRQTIHETERTVRRLKERLQEAETESMRDCAELSRLRETLYLLRSKDEQPEEESEEEIQFPFQTKQRIAAFGGYDAWRKAIRPMLPGVRFFDREAKPDINTIKSADVVWIQANAMSHTLYYSVINTARKENIPVRYFGYSSARKCAEQLVMDELSAN